MTTLQFKQQSNTNELLSRFDWSDSSLGPESSWPQSLRTAAGICLGSTSPALILWGKELTPIYNNAFKSIVGRTNVVSNGAPARDVWRTLWPDAEPTLQRVLEKGESFVLEDHPVVLNSKGYQEQCFFTVSCSPLLSEPGIGGVFISMNETIRSIPVFKRLRDLQDPQLRDLFLKAPIGLAILKGTDHVVEIANDQMLRMWGRPFSDVVGKPISGAIPEAYSHDVKIALTRAFVDGESVVISECSFTQIRKGKKEEFFTKLACEPLRENDGSISGIIVFADDITEQVNLRKEVEEAEMPQRIAIDAAEIGTFDLNLQTSEFAYSDKLVHIFGYDKVDGVTREHLKDRIHPDDSKVRTDAHEQAFDTGVLSYEARTIWPDGSIHWFKANGTVVYDKEKKPWRMFGTAIDITDERTQAERLERLVQERTSRLEQQHELLKRSEERYHKMVEEVQDYAIILLDKEGIIQNWNKGAEKIKQYKEEEVIGKPFWIFYLPQDRDAGLPEKLIGEAAREGRAVHEGWRVRKDGSRFWGSISITALHDDHNNIIGFSKVTRDLTQRKDAEDKLHQYTLELELRNQELEQFAYVASHDLQEPLRKILTFSEIVQRNLAAPEIVNKYLTKLDASAKRMVELIRSILNYSRLSRESLEMSDVRLNDVLNDVIHDFELAIQEKGAIIKCDSLPVVKGIQQHLDQLFSNLIANSLKFSSGQPLITVSWSVVPASSVVNKPATLMDEQYIEIAVADNGIGFDQQFEKQIFEMFQRLHGRHEYPGTGIGLAICRKIMENHKGHITARSTVGGGATFYLYFPVPDQRS